MPFNYCKMFTMYQIFTNSTIVIPSAMNKNLQFGFLLLVQFLQYIYRTCALLGHIYHTCAQIQRKSQFPCALLRYHRYSKKIE